MPIKILDVYALEFENSVILSIPFCEKIYWEITKNQEKKNQERTSYKEMKNLLLKKNTYTVARLLYEVFNVNVF